MSKPPAPPAASPPPPVFTPAEAIALIVAIDDAAGPDDAEAARRRASRHLKGEGHPPLPRSVLEAYPAEHVRGHLWTQFSPELEQATAPVLCRHLVDVLADPALAPPDAVATADALSRLSRRRGRPGTPLAAAIDKVARILAERACQSTDHLRSLLDTPDYPDLPTISLDVMRIEGVRWVLEILERRAALTLLSEHSRRLSRLTLKRSGETIRAFISRPDLLTLYDTVAVVSQVEGLLAVATRLLDALRDQEEERTKFVAPYDEEALSGFGAVLAELSAMLWKIAMKSVGRADVSASVFGATVHQLGFLYEFSSRLGLGRPAEFVRLEQTLQKNAVALAERLIALAADSEARDPAALKAVREHAHVTVPMLHLMHLDRLSRRLPDE
ncbi:MAG TPA: hypothetical protein VD860_02730 [Azospirillum sp.]|nr:hypothetical protein [Azospirillum sp.]